MKTNANILIVEDELYDVKLIRRSFERYHEQYELHFAVNLAHARMLLASEAIDLVITDWLLPDGQGLELIEQIRNDKLNIPVILITSRGNEHVAVRSFKLGVMEYLVKNPEMFLDLPKAASLVLREWQHVRQRELVEKKLRESENRYRLLTESISDVVWIIDPGLNRYTYMSPSVEKFLGYSSKELMYLPVNHSFSYETSKKVKESFQDAMLKLKQGALPDDFSVEMEVDFIHKDGSTRWGEIKANVLMDGKEMVGISGITRDITDRKLAESRSRELENLRQKMEVAERVARIKEQFLANMSHEIRTPLTGIIGMGELMMNTRLDGQQKLFLNTIQSSSHSLLNIINDILDLSKMEAGKLELNPKPFNLEKSGLRSFNLFLALANQKNLEYSFFFDHKLPQQVVADENRLGQILTNLISNAMKFTERGFVKVGFHLVESGDDALKIRMEVSDSGIGISPENQDKLFSIFSQVDDSDTRIHDGAGLGLSLSQRFARLMGGQIAVESTKGKGSRFWFDFPAGKLAGEHAERKQPEEKFSQLTPENCSILLVEDKKTNQLVISLMLKDAGCKVDVASNGQDALDMFEPGKYHLIFMDIQMPVMDGITAVKELRLRYTQRQLPPILGLSAKAMEGDAEYYIEKGLDDYLTKPVSSERLREKIAEWKDGRDEKTQND
jgi:PAS domain S-box-containing protein